MLEHEMQELRELPGRVAAVESQILQMRDDMKTEFSAVRAELAAEISGVRRELATGLEDVRGELHSLEGRLREEIRGGDRETRDYMRILYEDLVARISLISEGRRDS